MYDEPPASYSPLLSSRTSRHMLMVFWFFLRRNTRSIERVRRYVYMMMIDWWGGCVGSYRGVFPGEIVQVARA